MSRAYFKARRGRAGFSASSHAIKPAITNLVMTPSADTLDVAVSFDMSGADKFIVTQSSAPPSWDDTGVAASAGSVNTYVTLHGFGVPESFYFWPVDTSAHIVGTGATDTVEATQSAAEYIANAVFGTPGVNTGLTSVTVTASEAISGIYIGEVGATPPPFGDSSIHAVNVAAGGFVILTHTFPGPLPRIVQPVVWGYRSSDNAVDDGFPVGTLVADRSIVSVQGGGDVQEGSSKDLVFSWRTELGNNPYPVGPKTVDIDKIAGDAEYGVDYDITGAAFSAGVITAGPTISSVTVSINALETDTDYTNKTLTLEISNPNVGGIDPQTSTAIIQAILNNDTPPTQSVSLNADVSVTEGATATVRVISADGTALTNLDFTVAWAAGIYTSAGSVDGTITTGSTFADVNVPTSATSGNQFGESVALTLTGRNSTPASGKVNGWLTIEDADGEEYDGSPITALPPTFHGIAVYRTSANAWSMRAYRGEGSGAGFQFSGILTSTDGFTSVSYQSIEAGDSITYDPGVDPNTITIGLLNVATIGSFDAINFTLPDGAGLTLETTATIPENVYLGINRVVHAMNPDYEIVAPVTAPAIGVLTGTGTQMFLTMSEAHEFEPGNGITITKDTGSGEVDITEDLRKGDGVVRSTDNVAIFNFGTELIDVGTIRVYIDNTWLASQQTKCAGHHVRCAEGDTSIGTTIPQLYSATLDPAEVDFPGLQAAIKGVYRTWLYSPFQTGATTFDFSSSGLEADIARAISEGKTYFLATSDRTFDFAGNPADPPVIASMLTSDPYVCDRYDLGGGGYQLMRWRAECQAWELTFFAALRAYLDSLVSTYPTLWDHFGGIIRNETAIGLSDTLKTQYSYSATGFIDRLVETDAHLVRMFRGRCTIWQEWNFIDGTANAAQRTTYLNRLIEAGVRITGPDIIPGYTGQQKSINDSLVYNPARNIRKAVDGRRRAQMGNTCEHNSYLGVVPMADKLGFALTPVDQPYTYGTESLNGLDLDAVFWWVSKKNPPEFSFYKNSNGTVGGQGIQALMGQSLPAPRNQTLWRNKATLTPIPDQVITLVN